MATGVPIDMFTKQLSSILGRPVRNETGLDGEYDFKLQWMPDQAGQLPAADSSVHTSREPAVADNGPSIFTAITEQLGLRLESRKGTVPIYVIDQIHEPSEN